MTTRFKKPMLMLGTTILVIQFILPMHSVYGIEEKTDESESAETKTENLNTEKTEDEIPLIINDDSISSKEIQADMNSIEEETIGKQPEISAPSINDWEFVSYSTGPNLLQNTNFSYNNLNGGTITNWEMVGTTTPVNSLTRNITLNGMISGGWIRTSDSRFFLSLGQTFFNVSNQNNNGTMIIAQTINTVVGRTYQMSADFSSLAGTASFTMTAYNGNGVVAGSSGSLNTSTFSLTNNSTTTRNWNNRTMQFTATGTQTTIGYRIAGGAMPQGAIRFPNVAAIERILTLQASPAAGGTPLANGTSITSIPPGESTIITANPNDGYQFVRWELVSGVDAQIEELIEPETTFTMGSEDTVVRAIYEENQSGEVHVYHLDLDGQELVESEVLEGSIGVAYQTKPKEIEHYQLTTVPENASGEFTREAIHVTYVYQREAVAPVDPLAPDTEVDPENKPELPEDQGLLSIDFISTFNFGAQPISAQAQTYYAQPQRLLNEDGTVNEEEERPNYVQISDRRPEDARNGWGLAVTQKEQFKGEDNQELLGARISLSNQQVITAQGGTPPGLQSVPCELIPGTKRTLLKAQGTEGTGTWIYRFGDAQTAGESVALEVPKGANPERTTYSTTLVWELSAVPVNE